MGDVVRLGDFTVVVHGVKDPVTSTNQFLRPEAGNRWVAVDLEVTNTSDEPETFSALLGLEIQDSENRVFDLNVMSGVQPGPPDGELAPGGARRGTAVFEVPTTATGLRLLFKGEIFGAGQVIVVL